MNIESSILRKFILVNKPTGTISFFVAKDLYDNSEQTIYLAGSQKMRYPLYKVGNIVYAIKVRENKWWYIPPTQFKLDQQLLNLRLALDEYFGD